MKKIALSLSFLLCAFFSFAQFPNDVSTSNAQTLFHYKGALIGDKSIMIPVLDTLLNAATPYRGALTVRPQDSLLYMSDGVNWHPFVSSTNGWIVDSVYVERPLAVKIGTSGASLGKQVIYFLKESGLISGGIPFSTGCRTLTMPPSIYIINYNQYSSPSTDLTIDTSDATLNRTDRIVGDTNANIIVIKGTPSSLGLPPTYNPSSQFSLALISIPAASTCTPATNFSTTLYDENVGVAGGEWDVTTTGTISANRNNTDNPLHLTKAIFVATYTDSSQIVLTHTALQDTVTSSSVLVLPTYLNNRLTNPIQVELFLNSTSVSNNTVINSYINPIDTGRYQLPVIPFSAFGVNSQIYNKVVITFRGYDTSGAAGLYFDWIRIQKGITFFESNRYVDSTKIIAGNEYYYKGGIAYLAGAVGGSAAYTATHGVVLQGTNFKLQDTLNGAGTKIMWLFDKKAFRAGSLSGGSSTYWDIDSIGVNSVAMGSNNRATGSVSVSLGSNTRAAGSTSVALGNGVQALGTSSIAMGSGGTIAGGNTSVALGSGTFSSGAGSVGIGGGDASAARSISIGFGTQSKSYAGTVVGQYNDSSAATSSTAYNVLNKVFQIGIGDSQIPTYVNAMTVLFNGKTTLNKYGIGTFTGTPAYNLQVDASGNIIEGSTSGGSTNSNIGAGYRLAVPGTNNIKTVFAGTNITIDSTTNVNGLTITAAGSTVTTADSVITATSLQTVFPFTSVPASKDDFMIYRNGVAIDQDYYTISGGITFTAGVDLYDKIRFHRTK